MGIAGSCASQVQVEIPKRFLSDCFFFGYWLLIKNSYSADLSKYFSHPCTIWVSHRSYQQPGYVFMHSARTPASGIRTTGKLAEMQLDQRKQSIMPCRLRDVVETYLGRSTECVRRLLVPRLSIFTSFKPCMYNVVTFFIRLFLCGTEGFLFLSDNT